MAAKERELALGQHCLQGNVNFHLPDTVTPVLFVFAFRQSRFVYLLLLKSLIEGDLIDMSKFKISVLALGLAGAIASVPVFAAAEAGSANARQDVEALQARQANMDSLFNQNNDALIDQDPSLGASWWNRIKISGILNVDAGYATSRMGTSDVDTGAGVSSFATLDSFQDGDYSNIDLASSEIDVDAQVNSFTRAHVSFAERDDNDRQDDLNSDDQDMSLLDEAYVTFGDLTKSPLMATAGRQYVPFGFYKRHQITPTVVADLSETQATAAKVGFVAGGLVGSAYVFNGLNERNSSASPTSNHSETIGNGGLDLNYVKNNQNLGYNVGAGYLYNMADVDLISDLITARGNPGAGGANSDNEGYYDQVDAASAHARMNMGPFGAEVDYVTALGHFDTNDVPWGQAGNKTGAKPSAVNTEMDYNFKTMGHDSTALVSYQHTSEAVALGEPLNRYLVGYNIGILKNTDLKFQYKHDQNYSHSDGAVSGAGGQSDEVDARVAVRF